METKKPSISVLMPAYNAEKYIAEAIESILGQTFQDFEIIIIDDCSVDTTWDITKNYAARDPRIIAVKNERNLGIPANRNALVRMAKGDYIAWQDADDISLPTRLQVQYDFMRQNDRVGICGGYVQFFSENSKATSFRKYAENDDKLRRRIFKYSPVAQPVAMIRKNVFESVGLYDEGLEVAQDLDMSFKIGRKYKFANIPSVLLRYREHEKSVSHTKLKKQELNTIKIRMKYFKPYKASISDYAYNGIHFLSIFLIPPKLKWKIFNYFRNSL